MGIKPNAGAVGAQVTIQFDKVNVGGRWVPVVTNLRAIAGFMAVEAAQIPDEAPNEGSPYNCQRHRSAATACMASGDP